MPYVLVLVLALVLLVFLIVIGVHALNRFARLLGEVVREFSKGLKEGAKMREDEDRAPIGQQISRASAAPESNDKICPICAETIKAAALICRYCRHQYPTISLIEETDNQTGIVQSESALPPVARPSRERIEASASEGLSFVLISGGLLVVGVLLILAFNGKFKGIPSVNDASALRPVSSAKKVEMPLTIHQQENLASNEKSLIVPYNAQPALTLSEVLQIVESEGKTMAWHRLVGREVRDQALVKSATEIRTRNGRTIFDVDTELTLRPFTVIEFEAEFITSKGNDLDLSKFRVLRVIEEGPAYCPACSGKGMISISVPECDWYACSKPAKYNDQGGYGNLCASHLVESTAKLSEVLIWLDEMPCERCEGTGNVARRK